MREGLQGEAAANVLLRGCLLELLDPGRRFLRRVAMSRGDLDRYYQYAQRLPDAVYTWAPAHNRPHVPMQDFEMPDLFAVEEFPTSLNTVTQLAAQSYKCSHWCRLSCS